MRERNDPNYNAADPQYHLVAIDDETGAGTPAR
jgi:hypothetical protein